MKAHNRIEHNKMRLVRVIEKRYKKLFRNSRALTTTSSLVSHLEQRLRNTFLFNILYTSTQTKTCMHTYIKKRLTVNRKLPFNECKSIKRNTQKIITS